jgi:hypothetical protein
MGGVGEPSPIHWWLKVEIDRGEQIALRRRRPWQRAHWACDGSLLCVGPEGARLGELWIPEEGGNGLSSSAARRPGEETDARATQFLAPPIVPHFSKDVIPRVKSSGRKVLAVAVAPSGRFAAAVLDNLRVLLWDKISGETRLLTPPIGGGSVGARVGGMGSERGLRVSIAVHGDGSSVAIRAVSEGSRLPAPVWILLSEPWDACGAPEDGTGAWVMLPVDFTDSEARQGCAEDNGEVEAGELLESHAYAGTMGGVYGEGLPAVYGWHVTQVAVAVRVGGVRGGASYILRVSNARVGTRGAALPDGAALDSSSHRWVSQARVVQDVSVVAARTLEDEVRHTWGDGAGARHSPNRAAAGGSGSGRIFRKGEEAPSSRAEPVFARWDAAGSRLAVVVNVEGEGARIHFFAIARGGAGRSEVGAGGREGLHLERTVRLGETHSALSGQCTVISDAGWLTSGLLLALVTTEGSLLFVTAHGASPATASPLSI